MVFDFKKYFVEESMSNRRKIVDIVTKIAKTITDANGFELVEVEYLKEGSNWYLRVYIDKQGGISIDDCQLVSEEVGKKIDEIDPITKAYYLEVSSPGLDRPLKTERDFEKYSGEKVVVKLRKEEYGAKKHIGKLIGLIDKQITIESIENGNLQFEKENVLSVKRLIEF
jgi:ribosome maturation factor RimP